MKFKTKTAQLEIQVEMVLPKQNLSLLFHPNMANKSKIHLKFKEMSISLTKKLTKLILKIISKNKSSKYNH